MDSWDELKQESMDWKELNNLLEEAHKSSFIRLKVGHETFLVVPTLLMERSDYFKSMFGSEFKEMNTFEIEIQLPHEKGFGAIYWFLMTGKIKK